MITATIEETNHKLDDVIKNQQASQATVSLLEQFVNKIDTTLKAQDKPVFFRTHKYGVGVASLQAVGGVISKGN